MKKQTNSKSNKRPRKYKFLEFTCMALYYFINAAPLLLLLQFYLYGELFNIGPLSNPLLFALAIAGVGLLSFLIYYGLNFIFNALHYAITKKYFHSLYGLAPEETSLIAIINCLLMGSILFFSENNNLPEYSTAYLMLFSLPIGKLTFLDSTPCGIWKGICEIYSNAKGTLPFIIPLCAEFWVLKLFPDYSNLINLFLGIVFIVSSLWFQLQKLRSTTTHH